MAFPSSPSNNQIATVNNIPYVYASATNTWTRTSGANVVIGNGSVGSTSTSTGALVVNGGAGISGNVYTSNLVVGKGSVSNGQVPGLVAGSAAYVTIMGARLGDTGSQVTGAGALEIQGGSGSGNGVQGKIDFVSKSTGNVLYNTARITVTNTSADTASGVMLFGTRNGSAASLVNNMTLTEQGNLTVNGGLQNTPIGNATASTGAFTTISTTSTVTVNSSNAATAINNGGTTGTGNIGSATSGFNTIFAKATSAQYADLAEKYLPDMYYTPGTVVVFGGEKEITQSTKLADNKVAGVISTAPAYQMNSDLDGGLYVALTGRVPCKVVGKIEKGNMLVTSGIPGIATAIDDPKVGQIIGKSLEDYDSEDVGVIEVVVGGL